MRADLAEEYASLQTWHWWFRGRQRVVETVLRRELGHRTPLRIVSLGCGPVSGLQWLRAFAGTTGLVVGLDTNQKYAVGSARPPWYVAGRFEALPFAPRSFDVVLALDVLEHLDNDEQGMLQAVKLLKPGGLLMLTVPALPGLWGKHDVVSHHCRRYTKQTLLVVFERAQLPPPKLCYFNTFLFPVIAAVRWFWRGSVPSESTESDFARNRPGIANEILAAIFSCESHLVGRLPMPIGVSLLAVFRS